MFYTADIIDKIEEKAIIFYTDRNLASAWNRNRRGKELRLLTGFTWQARDGSGRSRTGFKSRSAAMRDAYYVLIELREQPADVGKAKIIKLNPHTRARRVVGETPRLRAVG